MKTVTIEHQVYKIGLHGFVFVQRNGDWVRSSNYTREQVEHQINGPKK